VGGEAQARRGFVLSILVTLSFGFLLLLSFRGVLFVLACFSGKCQWRECVSRIIAWLFFLFRSVQSDEVVSILLGKKKILKAKFGESAIGELLM